MSGQDSGVWLKHWLLFIFRPDIERIRLGNEIPADEGIAKTAQALMMQATKKVERHGYVAVLTLDQHREHSQRP